MRNLTVSSRSKPVFLRILSSGMLFPFLLTVWFLYFTFVRSQTSNKSLRGPSPAFNIVDVYKQSLKGINAKVENLIIVAGHAVLRLNKLAVADSSDSGWYLLSYQQNQGFPAIISSHIQSGLKAVASDPQSILVFSGGQTRRDVGPTSEAASYYYLASEKNWMTELKDRVFLEEYARDSFENLLFSVCRFRELQGYYPSKITVVGFDFKGKRYTQLHRKAIGFPAGNFSYIGVHSPSQFDQDRAVKGEAEAWAGFEKDMYGCSDPSLKDKRRKRNPFQRTVPYPLACPELVTLLSWCGPDIVEAAALPWSEEQKSILH